MNTTDDLMASMCRHDRASVKRYVRKSQALRRILSPLRRIPVAGDVAATFWSVVLLDGPGDLFGRGGALSFAYLNDGVRPSLWATWQNVTDNPRYAGIWPGGAPRNRFEAEAIFAGGEKP